ncbi:MAG: isochorismatase family cysteine hydrolase [Actinomycetota bacterium]|nr:isochorismatase family cysteine hydrolase [Actinomycetota bacterium]
MGEERTQEPGPTDAGAFDLVRRGPARRPLTLGALAEPVAFDLARTALVVVDMQHLFLHPDGLASVVADPVEPPRAPIGPLRALLPVLRGADVPIVWVNWGNRADRANLTPALRRAFARAFGGRSVGDLLPNGDPILTKGSWSAAIDAELEPAPTDIGVDKYRHSGFWDTELDSVLRNLDVTTLLFAGVNTDQCVLHTLADASFLGYDCILLEDCTATTSPRFCVDAALFNIRDAFGFTATSGDLRAAIDRSSPRS